MDTLYISKIYLAGSRRHDRSVLSLKSDAFNKICAPRTQIYGKSLNSSLSCDNWKIIRAQMRVCCYTSDNKGEWDRSVWFSSRPNNIRVVAMGVLPVYPLSHINELPGWVAQHKAGIRAFFAGPEIRRRKKTRRAFVDGVVRYVLAGRHDTCEVQ